VRVGGQGNERIGPLPVSCPLMRLAALRLWRLLAERLERGVLLLQNVDLGVQFADLSTEIWEP
jgi:hypothetical protein